MIKLLVKGFHEDVRDAVGDEMMKIRDDFQIDVIIDYVDGHSREPTVEIVTDHEEVRPSQERAIISRVKNAIKNCESMSHHCDAVSTTLKFSQQLQA